MRFLPRRFRIAVVILILASLACQLPQSSVITPTSLPITPAGELIPTAIQSNPTAQGTLTPILRPTSIPTGTVHLIATHRIYGIAEFFNHKTGQSFIPRGTNYAIQVPVQDHYEDRIFSPGVYDHNRTQVDFSNLVAAGYNTLRIILDDCHSSENCIGSPGSSGLNPTYIDNIVDLMNLAKQSGLFLLLASRDLPESGGYASSLNQATSPYFAPGRNSEYLTLTGISAYQKYWSDILGELIVRNAPIEIVLAWEIQAEAYYLSDQPPFSLDKGKITPADRKAYDLSDPAQKQVLGEEGFRFFIQQVRQAILTLDPTAMVTMGFFAPDEPNTWRQGDDRYIETAGLLPNSALDFYDLHAYPDSGLSMSELAENFGLGNHITKPVLMGEVGAYTLSYPQVMDGAIAVQDWIVASCSQGYSGWLYSGYYPDPSGLSYASWGLTDVNNTILNAISPKNQPDACKTTPLPGRDLALGKPVTVSAALPDQSPDMAVDGDPNTQWSSGEFPMQWIQVDLGAAYTIGAIRLTIGQWPEGKTDHQVWVGSTPDALQMVNEFIGQEYDYDVLTFIPSATIKNVRFVRIVTTESPSWVSWREIEVLAASQPAVQVVMTPTP